MKTNSAGALLFAIITASILSILGGGLCIVIVNHSRSINSEIERTKAFYLAQAGMEYAIYQAYTNPAWLTSGPYPITIGGKQVNISITEGGLSNYTIQITTTYES